MKITDKKLKERTKQRHMTFIKYSIIGIIIIASFIGIYLKNRPPDTSSDIYIIKWYAVDTRVTGSGTIGFSKEEAEAIAKKLNIEWEGDRFGYGKIIHWIEGYTKTENYLPENCIAGQLFYDIEDEKNPKVYICYEPKKWFSHTEWKLIQKDKK